MDIKEFQNLVNFIKKDLSYEDISKYNKKNVLAVMKEMDNEELFGLALLYKENDFEFYKEIINNFPETITILDEVEMLENLDLLRNVVIDNPDLISNFSFNVQDKIYDVMFEALKKKPVYLKDVSLKIMDKYSELVFEVLDKGFASLWAVPKDILNRYPQKLISYFKRKPELLMYINEDVQLNNKDEIIKVVRKQPKIYDYLVDDIKKESFDIFCECLKLDSDKKDYTVEQLEIAYEMASKIKLFFHQYNPVILDKGLVNSLSVDNLISLVGTLAQEDIVQLSYDVSKFECFKEIIKNYKGMKTINSIVETVYDNLKKNFEFYDFVFVEDEEESLSHVSRLSLDNLYDSIYDLLLHRELTELERKRLAYIVLKNRGIIKCTSIDDFLNFDIVRQRTLEQILLDDELTLAEAKNVLYEYVFGMSYSEVNNLLYKYGADLEKLLNRYDKVKISLDELDEKKILLTLWKMSQYSKMTEINEIKAEIESSSFNYKGEEKIYDEFLYLEEQLKNIYNKDLVNKVNKKFKYESVERISYEDLVPEEERKEKYLGKMLEVRVVDPTSRFFGMISSFNNSSTNDKGQRRLYAFLMTQISNLCFAVPKEIKKIGMVRFENIKSESIIARAPYKFGKNITRDISKAKRESMYFTGDSNISYTRDNYNSILVDLWKLDSPSFVECYDKINVNSVEIALDLDVPIELYERKKFVEIQRDLIDLLFNKFEIWINDEINLKKCPKKFQKFIDSVEAINIIKVIVDIFCSLRISFFDDELKNEMLEREDSLLNSKILDNYLNKVVELINWLIISDDTDKARLVVNALKEAIMLEQKKLDLFNLDDENFMLLGFNKKTILREVDKLDRKLRIEMPNMKYDISALSALDKNLDSCDKHYNYKWRKFGGQLDFIEINGLINKESIYDKLQLVYSNGLYENKKYHSPSHIERVAIFSSILANMIDSDSRLEELAILAALYHDCGRVDEYIEKHGDCSASIARAILSQSNNYSKEEINLVCAAVDYHDEDDLFEDVVSKLTKKYKIKDEERLIQLCNILKDADALDRMRFMDKDTLDIKYLNYNESLCLLKFASSLNEKMTLEKLQKMVENCIIKRSFLEKSLNKGLVPQLLLRRLEIQNREELKNFNFEKLKVRKVI